MEEKSRINSGIVFLIITLFIVIILLTIVIFKHDSLVNKENPITDNASATASSYSDFLKNVKKARQTHVIKEYVRSLNGTYSVSINQIGYLYVDDTLFVDGRVLLFWVVPSGGYNDIYYIKEDGSFCVATETVEGTFETNELSDKNVLSVMPSLNGAKSIGTGEYLKYKYDNFLKNAILARQASEMQKLVKSNDTTYSIRLNKDGVLYVDDKKLDTDVVTLYSLLVGNGGFESLYYVKEDGTLYTAGYSYDLYKGQEIGVKKLEFENIVSVIPGKVLTASYPIFIDINGNAYSE